MRIYLRSALSGCEDGAVGDDDTATSQIKRDPVVRRIYETGHGGIPINGGDGTANNPLRIGGDG